MEPHIVFVFLTSAIKYYLDHSTYRYICRVKTWNLKTLFVSNNVVLGSIQINKNIKYVNIIELLTILKIFKNNVVLNVFKSLILQRFMLLFLILTFIMCSCTFYF